MAVLTIKNLTKRFKSVIALDDISFEVESGDIFGFLGPNGAGKSTTIRCILNFLRPTSGQIKIFDQDSQAQAVKLKQRIGYVPSEPVLYQNWTVDEHFKFVAKLNSKPSYEIAQNLAKKFNLDVNKKVKNLSTGNQQKAAIILAIATKPDLLILDEPTRGLDPLLRSAFHKLLKYYQRGGGTVLLSSHDLSEVEELCNRVVVINQGRVVNDTTVQELRGQHGHVIRVTFERTIPDLTKFPNLENLVVSGNYAQFNIKGDVNPILSKLSLYKIRNLEITATSLEEIFMEIYR